MSDYSVNSIEEVFATHASEIQKKRLPSLLATGYALIKYVVNPSSNKAVGVFSDNTKTIALYPDGYHDIFLDNQVAFRKSF